MPSVGYCILFVHGLSKLCTCLHRCGATTLTASTVLLLLLLFSWKTIEQNEIWPSRESLFRLYPRYASALNNLRTLTRDTAEAKTNYQKALQLNPQHNWTLKSREPP
ncbi:protein O-mannosyl-transferase TMTC1-like [Hipposideros larvatus]